MKCKQCSTRLSIGEKFCGECGSARLLPGEEFLAAEEQFLALEKLRQAEAISKDDYTQAAEELTRQDGQGNWWRIDGEAKGWQFFNGREWVAQDPGEIEQVVEQAEAPGPAVKVREEPAEGQKPRSTTKEQPATAQKPAERKQPGGKPGGRIALIVLAGLAVCVFVGALAYQPLLTWLASRALESGYGTVVTSEPADQSAAPAEAIPTLQPLLPSPTLQAVEKPAGPTAIAWKVVECPASAITFQIPVDFSAELYDEGNFLVLRSQDGRLELDLTCYPASHSTELEGELAWWLEFQAEVNWGEMTYGETAIGPIAWGRGKNPAGDPIFSAVVGPNLNRHVVNAWGLAPTAEFESAVELFLEIVNSGAYAE